MKPRAGGPCAVVMGLDVAGYGIVRSLGRKDVPIVGLWRKANECARFSRYCTAIKVEPDEDSAWLKAVTGVVARYDRPVLLPSNDRYTDLLARHQDVLRSKARFHWVPPESLDVVLDKTRIAEVVRGAGLPVPRTHRPQGSDRELQAEAAAFVYPCLVKPITTFRAGLPGGLKALTCASADELLALYRGSPDLLGTTFWQEIIEGGDDTIYQGTALVTQSGEITGMACVRKIRQFVPGYGITSFGRTEWNETVVDQTTRLVRALDWRGFASVEFKRSVRDDRFYFIEMNPRLPWYNVLFVDSGLNLPYLAWCDLTGAKAPQMQQREGVGWISLASDVASFWQRRSVGTLSAGAWLESLADARSFSWYDTADPMPALATAVRLSGLGLRLMMGEPPTPGRPA
jgi:D-aspartate ligase